MVKHFTSPEIHKCRLFDYPESDHFNLLVKDRQENMYGAYGIIIVKTGPQTSLDPKHIFPDSLSSA